jgi:hypothetical protein
VRFLCSYKQLHTFIYITLKTKNKRQRLWWKTQLNSSREVYSGSSLLADLNFQPVSGLYKNFTRMSPTECEYSIHLIGEKISKKDTTFRKAISVQEILALTLRFLASGDSSVVNTVTKTAQKTARHCKSAPSSSENHEE